MNNSWILRSLRRLLALWSWSWGKYVVIVAVAAAITLSLYSSGSSPSVYKGTYYKFTLDEGSTMSVLQGAVRTDMASPYAFILGRGEELLGSHQSLPPVGWNYSTYYSLSATLEGTWTVEKSVSTVYVLVQSEAESSVRVLIPEGKKTLLGILAFVIFGCIVILGVLLDYVPKRTY